MKVTYHGCPAATKPFKHLIGLTFDMPDDDTVSFGTWLLHEGKNYCVLWCECSVIYDDPELNDKHGVIVPNAELRRPPENNEGSQGWLTTP